MARKSLDFQLTPEQQRMALDNINLARREAWRVQRTTGIDYSVLEGAAFLGLCKACHRFNPESGYKFSSLATPTIRGELLHWVRDRTYSMRLSHKMRENWIKGRKMMYEGKTDILIAEGLDISLQEWQETRSACSGPPLELKDQAMPSEPLEPEEIDFTEKYINIARAVFEELIDSERNSLIAYFTGNNNRAPHKVINNIFDSLKGKKIL